MFEVDSTIKLNFGLLKKLENNAQTALEQTTDALLTEVKNAEVMPFDTGNLQNESTFADCSESAKGITRIVSTAPYARRLYYHPEYNFSRREHLEAGGKWLDPWLKGGTRQNFCCETFAKIYKRLSKT